MTEIKKTKEYNKCIALFQDELNKIMEKKIPKDSCKIIEIKKNDRYYNTRPGTYMPKEWDINEHLDYIYDTTHGYGYDAPLTKGQSYVCNFIVTAIWECDDDADKVIISKLIEILLDEVHFKSYFRWDMEPIVRDYVDEYVKKYPQVFSVLSYTKRMLPDVDYKFSERPSKTYRSFNEINTIEDMKDFMKTVSDYIEDLFKLDTFYKIKAPNRIISM